MSYTHELLLLAGHVLGRFLLVTVGDSGAQDVLLVGPSDTSLSTDPSTVSWQIGHHLAAAALEASAQDVNKGFLGRVGGENTVFRADLSSCACLTQIGWLKITNHLDLRVSYSL